MEENTGNTQLPSRVVLFFFRWFPLIFFFVNEKWVQKKLREHNLKK